MRAGFVGRFTPVRNVIGTLKDLINFIRDSPKQLNEFKELKEDDSPLLSAYCPTRYVIFFLETVHFYFLFFCISIYYHEFCKIM